MSQKFDVTEEEERFWREMNQPVQPVDNVPRASGGAYLFDGDHSITASYEYQGGFYSPTQRKPSPKKDAINPDHYKKPGGIECIDAIRSALSEEEFRGYCKGNALAYLWRLGKKDDPVQEAGKTNWYVTWLQGKDPRK